MFNTRLDEKTLEKVRREAYRLNVSRAEIVRRAIKNYFEKK